MLSFGLAETVET